MKHGFLRASFALGIVIASIFWLQSALHTASAGALGPESSRSIQTLRSTAQVSGTITLWHSYPPGGPDEAALATVVAHAQAANPGLTVTLVFVSYDQLIDLYNTSVMMGGGPDLLIASNDNLGSMARNGVLVNLDPWLPGQFTTTYPVAVDGLKVNGHLYGVPESSKAVALYYNKTQLPVPPTTTLGLLHLIQSGHTMSFTQNAYHPYGFWAAFGGTVLNAQNHCIADQGGVAPAMQYLLDLQGAGATFTPDGAQATLAFRQGQIDLLIDGPWMLNDIQNDLGNNAGLIPLPSGPAGPSRPMLTIDGFFINPNTAHVTTTVAVALYLTNRQSSQTFTTIAHHIPVRTDITSTNPLVLQFAQAAAQGSVRPQSTEFGNYWDSFGQMIDRVMAERVNPVDGVADACRRMDAFGGYLPASTTPTTGTVTLWYAYGLGGGEEHALVTVIDNARAVFTDTSLRLQPIPFNELFTRYENEVSARGGPDLFVAPNDWLGPEARSGVLRNLDPWLQGQLGSVSQSAIDGMQVGGHLYGVPESAKAVALYYNKSVITTPPTTTAELLSQVQNGKRLMVIQNAYHSFGLWEAFGGHLLDANNRCIADQGGFDQALQYLLDLRDAGAVFTSNGGYADDQFRQGQIDLLIDGPWMLADFQNDLGSNLGVVLLPIGPGGPAQPLNGIDGFYVNPNTIDTSKAVSLALYLTNQSSAQIYTDLGGHVPIRADVTSTNEALLTFAAASVQGYPRPQSAEFTSYWGPFGAMLDDAMAGVVTPTLGVQQACAAMNDAHPLVPITPSNSGTIGMHSGDITATLHVPAGAVSEPISLTYQTVDDAPAVPPPGATSGGLFFDLNAHGITQPLPGYVFAQPVTLTIHYSDADVQDIVPESSLKLYYLDDLSGLWIDAATTCVPNSIYVRDTSANLLSVAFCHLSRFGTFGQQAQHLYLPLIRKS
jgi:arabinogalactan oligomer/maltooligosaccharide transport system substrate-binding protein